LEKRGTHYINMSQEQNMLVMESEKTKQFDNTMIDPNSKCKCKDVKLQCVDTISISNIDEKNKSHNQYQSQSQNQNNVYEKQDEKGRLLERGYYVSGVKNGEWNIYRYYLGNRWILKEKVNYSNDRKNGAYEMLNAKLGIILKGSYIDDVKHGLWEEYICISERQKTLKEKGNYINGVKEGLWEESDDYKKITTYNYVTGIKV